MKQYKVGDTIYAKGIVRVIDDDDKKLPYYVDFGNTGWIPSDNIIDELPTAEPVNPVLPKDVADEIQQAKDMRLNFYMYIIKFAKDSATCDFALYNCLADVSDEQFKILSDAWYNGYTVEQEPRYMVYVPGTNKKFLYNKRGDSSTRVAKLETPIVPSPVTSCQAAYSQYKPLYWFTDEEITKFDLQDCGKELVADD